MTGRLRHRLVVLLCAFVFALSALIGFAGGAAADYTAFGVTYSDEQIALLCAHLRPTTRPTSDYVRLGCGD